MNHWKTTDINCRSKAHRNSFFSYKALGMIQGSHFLKKGGVRPQCVVTLVDVCCREGANNPCGASVVCSLLWGGRKTLFWAGKTHKANCRTVPTPPTLVLRWARIYIMRFVQSFVSVCFDKPSQQHLKLKNLFTCLAFISLNCEHVAQWNKGVFVVGFKTWFLKFASLTSDLIFVSQKFSFSSQIKRSSSLRNELSKPLFAS